MGWAELEPWDRRARLARIHPRLTEDCLIAKGRTVAELRPEIDVQQSKEDGLRVVLRYFERHHNPDPEHSATHGPRINGYLAAHDCPVWERLPPLQDEESAVSREQAHEQHGERRAPGRIPLWLVEKAVQLHVRDRLGRRKLAESEELPGLTEYQAGQILAWYRVGKPAGLWLDEQQRLKWGAPISTTSDGMQLTRL